MSDLRAQLERGRYRAITFGIVAAAILQLAYSALRGGSSESQVAALAMMLFLSALLAITFAVPTGWERFRTRLSQSAATMGKASWWLWGSLLLGMSLGSSALSLELFALRVLVFWLITLLGAVLLQGGLPGRSFSARLAVTVVVAASMYKMAGFLPSLSTYPLALSWSETSRYYYASLFASSRLYGIQTSPSVLHPSRYLLQALPFLLSNSPLWLHRLWQTLLWLGLTLATAVLLTQRLAIEKRLTRSLVILLGFLFLFQGPILYHLLVGVVLVLWGFDSRRPLRSLVVVIIASVWAGISRINWIPVPGLLAATMYFLEERPREGQIFRYLMWPTLWVGVGSLTALLANTGYIFLSGNEPEQFGSSFAADLLWYRLLPNPTYRPGILFATALVSAPAFVAVRRRLKGKWDRVHPVRRLALGAILGTTLVGGTLVSVKIGGGSNLHNLDAYLIVLLILGTYAYFGRASIVGNGGGEFSRSTWGLDALALAVPALFVLSTPINSSPPARQLGQRVLSELSAEVVSVGGPRAQVLFISERHLVTFGTLGEIELIPGYEKVFLMEMAMSGTRSYLDGFHGALENQQFDLIVSDPLKIQFQGRTRAFGEENDAWVREVSYPVLCYYEPVLTISEAEVQVLKPRAGGRDCPDWPPEAPSG
ncbi:MAG: hypothetical protein ACE5MM_02890 [Nitrospiraceae bacterium]